MMTVNEALTRVCSDLTAGKISKKMFDMYVWFNPTSCGTVGCIGGWAMAYMGGNELSEDVAARLVLLELTNSDRALHELFYPSDVIWDLITPSQAAKAIEQYLFEGDVEWSKIKGTVSV